MPCWRSFEFLAASGSRLLHKPPLDCFCCKEVFPLSMFGERNKGQSWEGQRSKPSLLSGY